MDQIGGWNTEKELDRVLDLKKWAVCKYARNSHRSTDCDLEGAVLPWGCYWELCWNWRKSRKEMKDFPKLCQFSESPSLEIFVHYIRSVPQHCGAFLWLALPHCSVSSLPSPRLPSPSAWSALAFWSTSLTAASPQCNPVWMDIVARFLPLKNLCQRNYFWLKFEPLCMFLFMERNYPKKFWGRNYPFIPWQPFHIYRQV